MRIDWEILVRPRHRRSVSKPSQCPAVLRQARLLPAPTDRSRQPGLLRPLKPLGMLALVMMGATSPAMADWSVTTGGALFYTDDVALFSATRRSSIDGDPSQPVLDTSRTGIGSDMVFEPGLLVSNVIASGLGRTALSVKAQGFVFAVNPEFTQASVALEALHSFTPDTAIRLRYYIAPDQLLGNSEERRSGTNSFQEERVTSHIGYARFEQHLAQNWEVRLQGRVGVRRYNEAFAQRDTTFWTIGPHVFWRATNHLKLFAGYHYERGLSAGRHQVQFEDDNSYVQHFVAVGLDAELMEHLELELDFHYERNNWTSGIPGDERFGGHENIFQGNARLLYQLTEHAGLTFNFQRAQRRQNFEQTHDHNTNVGTGVIYRF